VKEFLQLAIPGLMVGGLYALVAAAIVLVYKSTRVVSLAHGQLLAFGGLFFWIGLVVLHLPLPVSILMALVCSTMMGWLVERVTLRPLIGQPLISAFLMTFAIFMALDGVFQLILKGESKTYANLFPHSEFEIAGVPVRIVQLISFIAVLFIFLLLALFFRFTRTGLGMRATAEDHQLSQSTGINVRTIFSLIWIISAVVASAAGMGTAYVMDIHFPLPYIGIKGLIVALFGGLDSLPGALLAGLILGMAENVFAGYLDPLVGGGLKDVAAYALLLVILLVKPYGLFGLKRIERV
jgi:branched-chain amino acid transport system permease protein